jgi:hypothetical protein
LDKEVVGKIGEGYSDTLRTIIMNWLNEQGYLAKKTEKTEPKQPENSKDDFEIEPVKLDYSPTPERWEAFEEQLKKTKKGEKHEESKN